MKKTEQAKKMAFLDLNDDRSGDEILGSIKIGDKSYDLYSPTSAKIGLGGMLRVGNLRARVSKLTTIKQEEVDEEMVAELESLIVELVAILAEGIDRATLDGLTDWQKTKLAVYLGETFAALDAAAVNDRLAVKMAAAAASNSA